MSFQKGVVMTENQKLVARLETVFSPDLVGSIINKVVGSLLKEMAAVQERVGGSRTPTTTESNHVATATKIDSGSKWREYTPREKAEAIVRANVSGTSTKVFAKNTGATETAVRAFVFKHKLSGKTKLPRSFQS